MDSNSIIGQLVQRQAATAGAIWASVSLIIYLFAIWLAWYALGSLAWERWVKHPRSRAALVLRLLLSIIIGYQISQFILGYITASVSLKGL